MALRLRAGPRCRKQLSEWNETHGLILGGKEVVRGQRTAWAFEDRSVGSLSQYAPWRLISARAVSFSSRKRHDRQDLKILQSALVYSGNTIPNPCLPQLRSGLRGGQEGFAGSGSVFGFREAVADSLDLVTERMGAETDGKGMRCEREPARRQTEHSWSPRPLAARDTATNGQFSSPSRSWAGNYHDHQRIPEATRVILDYHVPCLRERCYNAVVCDDQGHPMTRDTRRPGTPSRGWKRRRGGSETRPYPTMRLSPSARSLER